ncbi:MAG: hypothetical protein A3G34_04450 [Candidatus Lindowbacteria bacterium RIFCSPLOWO2_12_FULL_62_27]|nr:MAG: hypothetical protein A3I06_04215 [Candidatus Lindowbacteria bacterium RIFCSPLOWO2_02_FULL_62_12]OGH57413.1 MAG: hypothetical protein A3G34_04450 [Candidatus Lindowbacteria bacterium RIFCSPLOWO2_12_FULL_62_27]
MTAPSPEKIGKFRVLSVAATGGMATVYRGEDPEDGTVVAIKVLPEAFGRQESFVERFKREARIGMSLSHEAIPKIYDFGMEGSRYYMAMEWIDGKSLRAWLPQQTDLPDNGPWLSIFAKIAHGLAAAHAQGILHRDLTDGNVILMPDGNVRITDFGLSTMVREEHFTVTGEILGTPHYMAPEQIESTKDVTAQADLWSLGVLGYQMATLRRPFDGATSAEVIKKILDPACQAPPPRSLNPKLSVLAESVIRKCLERDPDRRYAQAWEIAEDLKGDPSEPVARRASAAGRRRLVSRIIAAATGLVILAGLGWWWQGRGPAVDLEDAPAAEDGVTSATDNPVWAPPSDFRSYKLPASSSSALLFDPRHAAALGAGRTVLALRGMTGGVKPGKVLFLYPAVSPIEGFELKPGKVPPVAAYGKDIVPIQYVALSVLNVKIGEAEIRRMDPWMAHDLDYALKHAKEVSNPLHAIVLRVFRLPKVVEIPAKKRHRPNWIRLDEEIPLMGAAPVLSDDEFEATAKFIVQALKGENPFKEKRVVIVGQLPRLTQEQAGERLKALGALYSKGGGGAISKNVKLVVVGAGVDDGSPRLQKAMEMGIPRMSGEEFERQIQVFSK